MCGIVSYYNPSGVNASSVEASLLALSHRGPDGTGTWFSDDAAAALGHARLSIVDLDTGTQPLFNEDKSIVAVVNGELYDDARLRAELEGKGHRFMSQSDSEILIHLYEEYGTDCLKHLRGEFAFVLYDLKRETFFAGRDRFGIKPLHYHLGPGGSLSLASEAKALLAYGIEARWDQYAFLQAATMQYQPQGRTMFEGISQLKPGHYLVAKQGQVQIQRYWDIDFPLEGEEHNAEDLVEQCKEKFEYAVKLRMRSDVPICCHLSGGLDSSAVLGTVSKYSDKPVDCFTVSFEADVYDELEIAKETAKFLGANLHVVPVSGDAIVDNMADAVYMSEGLAINGHLSAKYMLSKAIHTEGFKVVLGGEGADEALAGYSHLRTDLFKEQDYSQEQLDALFKNNPVTAGVHIAYGDALPMGAVQKELGYIPAFLEAKSAMGARFKSVLSGDIEVDYFSEIMKDTDVSGQLTGRSKVDQSSYLWTKYTLANYILKTLGDGTEMAHSVEGRVPFLDHHFFEFAASIPLNMKIRDEMEKHILREATRDVLTPTVYKRQKQAFMAPPVSRYTSGRMKEFMRDTIGSHSFKGFSLINQKALLSLLDKTETMTPVEQTAYEPVLMLSLTAALMHEQFNMKV
jgi:asparagine synthase (glutamine-hydrolysing)